MGTPARQISLGGRTQSLDAWAAELGCSPGTLRSRLDRLGWTVERALTTGVDERFRVGGGRKPAGERPVPGLFEHKSSGRGFARWREPGGRRLTVYFGAWGTEACNRAYARFAAEWAAGGRSGGPRSSAPLVADVCFRVLEWARAYYVKGGKPTKQVANVLSALRALNELYGDTPAADFTPERLRAVARGWVTRGLARKTVNEYSGIVKLAFSKAAGWSLVPAAVADALVHVEREQRGRTRAAEPAPRRSVPVRVVGQALAQLPADARGDCYRALVEFLLWSGCRPGEACAMRAGDVDRSGACWRWRVGDADKRLHARTREKFVWLGPNAQGALAAHLDAAEARGAGEPVFAWLPHMGARSIEPVPVTRANLTKVIALACRAAGVPVFVAHQLRHTRATVVRERYESDRAAGLAIGDTPDVAAAIYCDPSDAVARRIALETG